LPGAKVYKLAPMAKSFKVMTWTYALLTAVFMLVSVGPAGHLVGWIFAGIAVLVWFWFRPADFVVDDQTLTLHWPLRTRKIPRLEIYAAEKLALKDLGWALRIGACGLWGAFGLFITKREGKIDGYFSATENLVLLRLKNARPLMLSPEDAEGFIKELRP